jgi:Xaa-Pro aminopeptidase
LEEQREGMELVAITSPTGPLRMIKDSEEAEAIRRSCRLVSQNLEEIRSLLRPGMRETEIAALFEYSLKMNGADRVGFETIVASGPRSAMPHAHPSQREVGSAEFLKLDGGAQWQGYHSDMTRTWVLGSATSQQKQIFQIVLEAHDEAISAVRPGMLAEELDGVARRVIEEAGYGAYFGHGTGHGVGLSVHEKPRIGKDSQTPLAEGMAFTIEPGIYLPGVGGVRIEDTVLLTESGVEVLTTASREMTL